VSLVEAVPNVSEGRSQPVLAHLAASVEEIPGAALLDQTADPSHHRAVFTLASPLATMETAAVAFAAAVVAGVTLSGHTGVHPRVGAIDVLPFVPLGDTPMTACIQLAHRVGARLARELGLAVFLYEHAAQRPFRRALEDIRRGGLDGLRTRLQDPAWHPDYGPARLHPTAGAVCVGARGALVAWNLHLESRDLSIARDIARHIRASAGGLPHVKALGFPLAHLDRVQVSMNLTDYRVTPMALVYEEVRSLAAARGTRIAQSEIIGLVPRAALEAARQSVPWLGEAHAHQVLEDRLVAHGLPPASP
jgi:glutamate formiminotransferase / formiminotetrahydrofolate cyclodeaminase